MSYIDKHCGYFTYIVRSQGQIGKLTSQQFTRDNAYLTKSKQAIDPVWFMVFHTTLNNISVISWRVNHQNK